MGKKKQGLKREKSEEEGRQGTAHARRTDKVLPYATEPAQPLSIAPLARVYWPSRATKVRAAVLDQAPENGRRAWWATI